MKAYLGDDTNVERHGDYIVLQTPKERVHIKAIVAENLLEFLQRLFLTSFAISSEDTSEDTKTHKTMTQAEFIEFHESKGLHFFSQSAMSFFRSRIEHWNEDTGYFITSEQRIDMPRLYTIRKADFETGTISIVGSFGQYLSLREACDACRCS